MVTLPTEMNLYAKNVGKHLKKMRSKVIHETPSYKRALKIFIRFSLKCRTTSSSMIQIVQQIEFVCTRFFIR